MKIKILGSGTIIPHKPMRNCAAFLVDHQLLLDCGPGTWRTFADMGLLFTDMNHILVSHFHMDHVGDLPALLLVRYLLKERITRPLAIGGSAFLPEWFEKVKAFCGSWVQQVEVCLSALNDKKQTFCGYQVASALTGHTIESLCFRIEDQDKKILFYSGDTGYNENIIALAKGADAAILESSLTETTRAEGHLTPALAGKVGREAGVKRLILTHIYPHVFQIDIKEEVKKEFSGELILASDGMEIVI
jgi:ribonuclease BN (tRNA processing enzyme)